MLKSTLRALLQELEATELSRQFGSGWLSGVFALLCGVISFSAVLILHYPDSLSVPEIRSAVNVDGFRFALMLLIVVGFVLSCISMILRQNRVLAMSAALLIVMSIVIGGGATSYPQFSTRS